MDFLASNRRLGVESLLMPTNAAAVDWALALASSSLVKGDERVHSLRLPYHCSTRLLRLFLAPLRESPRTRTCRSTPSRPRRLAAIALCIRRPTKASAARDGAHAGWTLLLFLPSVPLRGPLFLPPSTRFLYSSSLSNNPTSSIQSTKATVRAV